ncbi:MAG: hypothetical protein NTX90_01615 [Alphaproteobacteria bacterium]|nr:hypothetical protein [Alphaproteobacteria bacterium]
MTDDQRTTPPLQHASPQQPSNLARDCLAAGANPARNDLLYGWRRDGPRAIRHGLAGGAQQISIKPVTNI